MTGPRALSREAVRELDRRAIEEHGIPSLLLMENAGRAAADEVEALLDGRASGSGPVFVLCGPGNNGGDGLVIARTLHNRGVPVRAAFVGPRAKLDDAAGDVLVHLRLWRDLGTIEVVETEEDVQRLASELPGAALVVDALFGTGLTRELRSPWIEVVRSLDDLPGAVLAVDLPSGLDANTGEVLGAAVRADVTVTFVAPKLGFERGEGPSRCGRVVVAEIGIPRGLVEGAG